VVYDARILGDLVDKLGALPHRPVLIVDCVFIQTEGDSDQHHTQNWPTTTLAHYEKSMFCYSFAKDIGIGGSRVGALCVSSGMRDSISKLRQRNKNLGFIHPNRIELGILQNLWKIARDDSGAREVLGPRHIFWRDRMSVLATTRSEMRPLLASLGLANVFPERGPPYVLAKVPDGLTLKELQDILSTPDPCSKKSIVVGVGCVHGTDGFVRFCLIRPDSDLVFAREPFEAAGRLILQKNGRQ
jgi:aspartate/methionine/tyrosine aminotransferase